VEHPMTIAVDLAKSVFEVAVSKEPGRVLLCPPFGLDTFWSPRMGLRKVAGDGRDQAEGRRSSHLFG
jgi:hypothetical protein